MDHQHKVSSERATLAFPRPDHTATQYDKNSRQLPQSHFKQELFGKIKRKINIVITSNLSLVPFIFMQELRHSPTTMPMCLMRTTLLSRWLCIPPSMHCSNSEKRDPQHSEDSCLSMNALLLQSQNQSEMFVYLLSYLSWFFLPDCSSCSSQSSSIFTLSSNALLTYSCCSRGVCFTALGLDQAWDRARTT